MSQPIISVSGLSKRYTIGHLNSQQDGLRHVIENAVRNPLKFLRQVATQNKTEREDFWALRDVSFDISRGDVVGIVGKNGAGKSTLLKILSRITEPTTGRIELRGRVASLLEVGTGFHQELTGRENIFLNGAILGMSKREIASKFDAIVAFSEIDRFLDTPVKRYSSGMYVRLAFAVAAHLDPEILIVDEVLAVGDASFQKKCLGKMGEVAKGGRTVLFVSHNMSAVQALCNRAVYLQKGTVRATGTVDEILGLYNSDTNRGTGQLSAQGKQLGPRLELRTLQFAASSTPSCGSLPFRVHVRALADCVLNDLSLLFYTIQGVRLAIVDLRSLGAPFALTAGKELSIEGTIKAFPLVEGDYSVGLYVSATDVLENFFDLLTLTVTSRHSGSSFAPYALGYRGVIELDHTARTVEPTATGHSSSL